MEYQLPRAVINVKQGAGRLIRDEPTAGLDDLRSRLPSKPMGGGVGKSLASHEAHQGTGLRCCDSSKADERTCPRLLPRPSSRLPRRGRPAEPRLRLPVGRSERLKRALEAGAGWINKPCGATRPHLFSDTVVFAGKLPATAHGRDRRRHRVGRRPAGLRRTGAGLGAGNRPQTGGQPGVFSRLRFPPRRRRAAPHRNQHQRRRGCSTPAPPRPNARLLRAGGGDAAAAGRRHRSGFVAMFRAEWQRVRNDAPLRRIAIVDQTPAGGNTWRRN